MAINATGGTLDVNSIVSQLMTVESKPLTTLQTKEAGLLSKISAYGQVKGSLSSFQTAVNALSSPSLFTSTSATATDATVLSASTSLLATTGSYDVTVTALAKAQSLASAAQASTISQIGSGTATTISFEFGTISGGTLSVGGVYSGASFTQDPARAAVSVVIDQSNNSLQGIRDAINRANVGVKATVVNDGAPGTPFHLMLTSTSTGLTSSMKISAAPGGDAAVASLLAYDPAGAQNFTQTSEAKNAALSVNGQPISSASNAVSDAIAGVTLNLTKIGTSSLAVDNNTGAVATAVQNLVKAFNDSNTTLKNITAYNPKTKTGGLLHGDSTITAIQAKLRNTFASALSGMGSNKLTNITDLGVAFQKDGTLKVDNDKLQKAVKENFGELAALFTAAGKTTDSLTSFAGSSAASTAGSYPVTVSVLATQGSAAGTIKPNALAGSTAANLTIGATNNQLLVNIDGGAAVSVTLTAGAPYASAAALATQVATDINAALGTAAQAGRVTVTEKNGKLTISSVTSGVAGSVVVGEDPAFVGNTGAASLLGTPVAQSTIVAGVNDALSVSISGTTATVKLAAGSYTATAMASQLQAAINGTTAFSSAGIAVSAASNAGVMKVTSTRFGASSGVNITGGTAYGSLFSGAAVSTAGVDVAGTINGFAATGSGQFLTGAKGNAADGIRVQVAGGAVTGSRGNINFSQGYAYLLNKTLDSVLSSSGAIATNTVNANNNIDALHKKADALNIQLTAVEKRYRTQYTALDLMLTRMGQTSNYLTQQLAALSKTA